MDPVMKVKYDTLKADYESLKERIRGIEAEMIDVGIQLGVMAQTMKEGNLTFNEQVRNARLTPIKRRTGDMVPLIPHPIGKAVAGSVEADFT